MSAACDAPVRDGRSRRADGVRPAAGSRPYGFAINGRFLTQAVTGVQRYAREIVGAMDDIMAERGGCATLLAPASLVEPPRLTAIAVERAGASGGQVWEQAILPFLARQPLLNLCNTAPALSRGHVLCIHDANVFVEPQSYSRGFRAFYRALQPLAARRALQVTTVSHDAASQLARSLGIPARRIRVLPNGYEHALRWDASRSTVFAERPPRRGFILLLASRARHKNIARIVGLAEAVDALGLDILVAGGGAAIFADVPARSAPNLVWLGQVSDHDLARLFSEALCLAFPSLTEGFGLPIVEAMACGCPVVSSDRASLPEVCGTAALLADPTEDGPWIRHFGELLASRHLSDDLRGRGREQVRRFSWAASARGYLDLFGH